MKRFLGAVLLLILLLLVGGGLLVYERPLWVADQQIRYHLWRSHVKSEYVVAGGYRLHYFEALPPAGSTGPERTLVLIHGLGSRGEDWSPLIPGLAAKGFHVYVPDLLGYGRSQQPDVDYSMGLEEKVVLDFLDAVHVQKADVGGWSMGGWVAMKLAVEHPERVDRLLLYDSAGMYFATNFAPDLFVPTDAAGLGRLMAAISPHPRAMQPFVVRAALRKLGKNAWVVDRSMTAMRGGKDLMDFRLHLIHEPTLIVWGSHDDLIPLSVGERMHQGIAGSVLDVIDGCGHLAPGECWKPVEEATLDFLLAEPAPQGGERHLPGANGSTP
jgi:pimeloyl-ACP methyl ester carboxylesterase